MKKRKSKKIKMQKKQLRKGKIIKEEREEKRTKGRNKK